MEVLFNETDKIGFFQKGNYKVRCELALKGSISIVVTAVFDTDVRFNLILADSLRTEWDKSGKMKLRRSRLNLHVGKRCR